jgi:hypothetical protein
MFISKRNSIGIFSLLISGFAGVLFMATGNAQTLSPGSLTFAPTQPGKTSAPQQVVLTNTTQQDLHISAVYAKGAFTQGNSCGVTGATPAVLHPKQSCTIKVLFTPQATGTQVGGLYVAQQGIDARTQAPLTGTGGNGQPTPSSSASISADFGSRSGSTVSIAPNLLGAGLGGSLQPATLPLMTQGGLNYTRFHAFVSQVYSDSSPDWSALDSNLAALQNAGIHAILEIDSTPSWLLPSTNTCPSSTDRRFSYPRDLNRYAQIAASFVTHIDHNFPGVVQDYEIWNEPDGGGLCGNPNTQSGKLSSYLSIYAAVAPAMRAAARSDGTQIRIGGPTLGSVYNASSWLSALVSNSSTAPYVDFVSYHYYASGPSDVNNGMTWAGGNGGPSLLAQTQTGSFSGVSGGYNQIASLVHHGSQPNAANTPIYVDEYNSDWGFVLDCCRNSATYSPVWNSLVIADLLNAAYTGAQTVPAKILYYAISNPPFCIAGQLDGDMDCKRGSAPQAYPQYYALRLFSDSNYLGLEQGGNMAASVQQSSNGSLVATAFYTKSGDQLVIVNTSGNNYSNMQVAANNTGLTASQATLYTLNSDNRTIATESVALTSNNSGGYTATVSVPPYSVVAVSLSPGK